jgi:hypothetical protein
MTKGPDGGRPGRGGRKLCAAAASLALWLPACANLDETANPDAVLQLTVTPPSVAADGFSTTTVVAELDPRTAERFRDVSFTTTLGRFVGGTSSQDTTIVVAADTQGRARATLRSGTLVGTAVVTAEVRDGEAVKISRSLSIPFERVPASNVLSVGLSAAEAPADGASVTNVVARIASALISSERTVTFSTTAGTFGSPNTQSVAVRAANDDTATAGLVSPRDPGTAVVTATINDVSARTTVTFAAALPEEATLSISGSFKLEASFSTKVILRLQLFRSVGTVTRGVEASFEATDVSTGRVLGFFSGITPSDSSGLVTAEFTPGNTTERGEAVIEARVRGTNLRSTVRVELVDP